MDNNKRYDTLLAGLPDLPHFDNVDYLPINRLRLDQRLSVLHNDDAEQLTSAETLLEWHYQPFLSETLLCEQHRQCLQQFTHKSLREYVRFRLTLRTMMAVLRYRQQPVNSDAQQALTTLNANLRYCLINPEQPDITPDQQFAWLEKAQQYLHSDDAYNLEHLLTQVIWNYLDKNMARYDSGADSVFCYVFKWDTLNRWLSYCANVAQKRFQTMQMTMVNDYCTLHHFT